MEQLVRDGRFRADLYFRLRIVEFSLPALRERGEDILLLARHFLKLHANRYRRGPMQLAPAAEDLLLRHTWPGNVRELRNLMEQAVLLANGSELSPEHLHLSPLALALDEALPGARSASKGGDGERLADVERNMLLEALAKSGWNVTQAARRLGISRDTLRYRIEKFGLSSEG